MGPRRQLRWALAMLLVGSQACDPDPPPVTGEGTTGTATGGATATPEPLPPEHAGDSTGTRVPPTPLPDLPSVCTEYLDEPEHPMTLRITNETAAELYLLDVDDCGSELPVYRLQQGEQSRWPRSCGDGVSCESMIGRTCLSPWCPLLCSRAEAVRLLPGETYETEFPGRIDDPAQLPDTCTGCETDCYRARTLAEGEVVDVLVHTTPLPPCYGPRCTCEATPRSCTNAYDDYDEQLVPGTIENASLSVSLTSTSPGSPVTD